jgi:hypothetical protein
MLMLVRHAVIRANRRVLKCRAPEALLPIGGRAVGEPAGIRMHSMMVYSPAVPV